MDLTTIDCKSDIENNVDLTTIDCKSDIENNVDLTTIDYKSDIENNVDLTTIDYKSDIENNVDLTTIDCRRCFPTVSAKAPLAVFDSLESPVQPSGAFFTFFTQVEFHIYRKSVFFCTQEIDLNSDEDQSILIVVTSKLS